MYGRASIAPCGHTGEHVIGNYVKCLVGCDGGGTTKRQGVVGHVLMCHCLRCNAYKNTAQITLRTREGKDFAVVKWDGQGHSLSFTPNTFGDITNYLLLDSLGEIVLKGTVEMSYFDLGMKVTMDVKKMIEAAASFNVCEEAFKISYEAPVVMPVSAPAPTLSIAGLEAAAPSGVPGLEAVRIVSKSAGSITGYVTEVSSAIRNSANWIYDQDIVRRDLEKWLQNNGPAGTSVFTYLRTPKYSLNWAVEECHVAIKYSTKKPTNYCEYVVNELANTIRFADEHIIRNMLTMSNRGQTPKGVHFVFDLYWNGQLYSESLYV